MAYCQLCGKYIKEKKGKPLCYDCWKKKNPNTKEEENESKKQYTYILKINDENKYYIGYTNNLRRRLWEHREGEVKETEDKEPELVYFEIAETKDKALFREKELKSMNKYQLAETIIEFKDLIKELGGK